MGYHAIQEEIPEGKQLLEDGYWLDYVLEESAGKKPKLIGELGDTTRPTANKRRYPRDIMAREIQRLAEAAASGKVYGTLDHPSDGKTRLMEVSHIIREMKVLSNGKINGVIELIPGTQGGDQAIAIARAGGKLGISSRGYGSTVQDEDGNHVVQEDYHLISFDIVADPANVGAHPNFVIENKEADMAINIATLKKEDPEGYESLRREVELEIRTTIEEEARDHARDALREEFEDELQRAADEIKDNALEQAREALEGDPEVAGAVQALESIKRVVAPFILDEDGNREISRLREQLASVNKKLAEADEARIALESDAEEIAAIATELGYNLLIERELGDDERKDKITKMLGDLSQYENIEALRGRIDEVLEVISEDDERSEEYDEMVEGLKRENQRLQMKCEGLEKLGHQVAARLYIEKKIGRHPRAKEIRELVERANPATRQEIDRLCEQYSASMQPSDEYAKVQTGLRRSASSDADQLTEDKGGDSGIFGVSFAELAQRSSRNGMRG